MTDQQNSTFEQMYGKLEKPDTPEKVSGRPVARSSRELLKQLEEQDEQS